MNHAAAHPDVHVLVDRWTSAERTGDAVALRELLDPEFVGTGPHGFVLDAAGWLSRFDHPFEVTSLEIGERRSTFVGGGPHGHLALVTGVVRQVASYRGSRSDGSFSISWVLRAGSRSDVEGDDGWRVLRVQLSGPRPDARSGPAVASTDPS